MPQHQSFPTESKIRSVASSPIDLDPGALRAPSRAQHHPRCPFTPSLGSRLGADAHQPSAQRLAEGVRAALPTQSLIPPPSFQDARRDPPKLLCSFKLWEAAAEPRQPEKVLKTALAEAGPATSTRGSCSSDHAAPATGRPSLAPTTGALRGSQAVVASPPRPAPARAGEAPVAPR